MSARRFVAYFFAIAVGSTFAFASTLRGQPPMSEVAAQQAAMERDMREKGLTPTATDAGLDALPPEAARLSRQSWDRHRAIAAGIARAK